jgi:hypothetical protein
MSTETLTQLLTRELLTAVGGRECGCDHTGTPEQHAPECLSGRALRLLAELPRFPFTVVGWWDNDGGGDYVGHVDAFDKTDALAETRAELNEQEGDGYADDLVVIAVFPGHLTEAR